MTPRVGRNSTPVAGIVNVNSSLAEVAWPGTWIASTEATNESLPVLQHPGTSSTSAYRLTSCSPLKNVNVARNSGASGTLS